MAKNIFTYIVTTPGSLVQALSVTPLSENAKIPILTFYAHDTQLCKDPNPADPWINSFLKSTSPPEGREVPHFGMSAIFSLVDYFHACTTEQSHLPKFIEQESAMHRHIHPPQLSGAVAPNNTHLHWAFADLTPEILRCILEQIGIAQKNYEARTKYIQHPEISGRTLKNLKEMRCANHPTPNFDTRSPLIDTSEFDRIIDAFTSFYEEQPPQTVEAYQNKTAYLNRYFNTNIPLYIGNQMDYFSSTIENAINTSFWTSGILSLAESVLKECSSLEPRQLANITHDLYLYLLAANPEAGVLPYIVLTTCQYLSPRQGLLIALSINASLAAFQNTEHEEKDIGCVTRVVAAATSTLFALATAVATSEGTRRTVSYGSHLLKRGVGYFYSSETNQSITTNKISDCPSPS